MKILLTNRYAGEPLKIVEKVLPRGFELMFLPEQTQKALTECAPEADYILAGGRLKITDEVLEAAKKLKMIQRSGVGLDALDLEAIKRRGVPLYVNGGVNAQSVAEYTLLLILACLRHLTQIDRVTKSGVWNKQEQGVRTSELSGKTVGVFGMGHIARILARLLQPFGAHVLYYDVVRAPEETEREYGVTFAAPDELLARSDVVTLHCALTDQTRGLMGYENIAKMKTGAILVNTARGGMIDEDALCQALESGKLSFAALDVHAKEPLPPCSPLMNLENVILTPHIAGVTRDSFEAMMRGAMRNIDLFEQGRFDEIPGGRYL